MVCPTRQYENIAGIGQLPFRSATKKAILGFRNQVSL